MATTDEVPDWAKLWLDRDVAQFLHVLADKYFGGNVELTMNELLRISMAMYNKPDDRWAGIEAHRRAHARGESERVRRSL